MDKKLYEQPLTKTLSLNVSGVVCTQEIQEESEVEPPLYAGPDIEEVDVF